VNDLISPVIGLLTGGVDFSNKFLALNGQAYASLVEAQKAGAPVLKFGVFLNVVINFVIVAFAIFLLVKAVNSAKKKDAEVPAAPPPQEKLLTEIRDLLAKK
jgi:large conductance mechanosensitive channel